MPVNKKSSTQNHYDTLGLKENCTEKDVKNAFLSLSKAHHPDLHPNDPTQQEKFVEIYEAYSVLSRPERRLTYDSDLRFRERNPNWNGSKVENDGPYYTTFRDETLWNMRNKHSENFDKNKPYYGIKGVNRVSNYWIAGGAVLVMLLGTLFHYTALKHSATFTVTQLDNRDEKFARHLLDTRRNAEKNGNDLQLQLFKDRFGWTEETKEGSNSTSSD